MVLLAVLAGCRIIWAGEVYLPLPGQSFRVTCHYELENCLRYAEKHCRKRGYEQITRKSCPRCGRRVPMYPLEPEPIQKPGYRAELYYQCVDSPRGDRS